MHHLLHIFEMKHPILDLKWATSSEIPPTYPLEDGPPDVSPTVYEGIPFFVWGFGEVWGLLPRVFFISIRIWSDRSKQLSTMKMLEGQDGARHVKLGTSLVAPHVALVVPWRLGVLLSRCQKCPGVDFCLETLT